MKKKLAFNNIKKFKLILNKYYFIIIYIITIIIIIIIIIIIFIIIYLTKIKQKIFKV